MTYAIKPLFFDQDWVTCQVISGTRRIGKFRNTAEAEAYLAKLATIPRHVPGAPGQQASPELRALAEESASELRLRGGNWKRKAIEEEDKAVDEVKRNLELPF